MAEELDLNAIYAEHERKDGRGQAAYHPLMLARVLLYAYAIAIRFLAADQHPDPDTFVVFRQQHLEQLAALFAQTLRLCQRAGLVKLGNVALDGTKIQASASREQSVSFARLSEQERRATLRAGRTDRSRRRRALRQGPPRRRTASGTCPRPEPSEEDSRG